MKNTKYIFVVGGVMSGIGKGVSSSSIGVILDNLGYDVNIMKVDPYLNVDAGTMNPIEHGEVFVLNSGLETDQDMGNYERFLHKDLTDNDYITSGMVYKDVIDKERSFGYKGECVEPMIHVIDEIKKRIKKSGKDYDVQIIEIGGTLGDYQNLLFLESARQMYLTSKKDVMFVIVGYLPVLKTTGELKTRPTQNAIRTLNSYGINPHIIIARSDSVIDNKRLRKISDACNVENIIPATHSESIYNVPVMYEKFKLGKMLVDELNLSKRKSKGILTKWKNFNKKLSVNKKVKIAIIGKYFETGAYILNDSYISIMEALKFSGAKESVKPEIQWFNAKYFENPKKLKDLDKYHAIIVPGGFGVRGTKGKMAVIKYARLHKIPMLGICYGLQLMVVEFARNVLGKSSANSIEIDPNTKYPFVTFIEGQKEKLAEKKYGGTMRLGAYASYPFEDTMLGQMYKTYKVEERHRHRYEVNPDYIDVLEEKGLIVSSYNKVGLVESMELEGHPFFVGTQFHPEFKARPFDPSPVFNGLITAAKKRRIH